MKPEKIYEYLTIIRDGTEHGHEVCKAVMHYVILVLSRFLMMMVNYHIFKQDLDSVTSDYENFNNNFYELLEVFKSVTGEEFIAGDIPDLNQLQVNAKKPYYGELNQEMIDFLNNNGLASLKSIFEREELSFEDLKTMDDTELKNIGVEKHKQRKTLIKAAIEISVKVEAGNKWNERFGQ